MGTEKIGADWELWSRNPSQNERRKPCADRSRPEGALGASAIGAEKEVNAQGRKTGNTLPCRK